MCNACEGDWKEVLKNLRPETMMPKEDDSDKARNIAWQASPASMAQPQSMKTKVKTGDKVECEYINDGSMADRELAKSNPDHPGKCKNEAEYWCDVSYTDEYSDSGKCGFRVCEVHYKVLTRNGKLVGETIRGSHNFDNTKYDDARRQSDYDDNQQFNEERFNRRTGRINYQE